MFTARPHFLVVCSCCVSGMFFVLLHLLPGFIVSIAVVASRCVSVRVCVSQHVRVCAYRVFFFCGREFTFGLSSSLLDLNPSAGGVSLAMAPVVEVAGLSL
jgi:hypothetical protein